MSVSVHWYAAKILHAISCNSQRRSFIEAANFPPDSQLYMNVKKKLATVKKRNPLVAPTLARKAGKHAPDPKGLRRSSNREAETEAEQVVRKLQEDKAG